MSNATVGNVYHQVIRDVIESSRVDFEEGGVDESVLEELSRVSSFLCISRCIRCLSRKTKVYQEKSGFSQHILL